MKFPYGNSDFYDIITEDYLYIDRTDRIPQLEAAGKSLLFLRPRRFGKSLHLSMLENYYDVAKADEFERLFGRLAIGQNPTPLHNQYLILRWDFSVVTSKPTYEEQQEVLTKYLNAEIKSFQSRYQHLLSQTIEIDEDYATGSFWSVLSAVRNSEHELYLLIDEYDNFANEVLMGGRPTNQERYEALVFGEGDFKGIFKAVKAAMAGRGLDRTFIVGVSPIVLHDVSSGYNIATNIYFRQEFNDLCGFTQAEVTALLAAVVENQGLPAQQIAEAHNLMRTYYNGSLFSDEGGEHIYNPTSTFYFLDYLQRTGRYPRKLLDSNLAPDHEKIAYVANLPKGEEVILNIVDETQLPSVVELEDRFGIKQMLAESNTETFMLSLLYYLGVLTLDGGISVDGELMLRIPNAIMRQLYVDRLQKLLLPNAHERDDSQEAAKALYSRGEMQPLCDFIEQHIFPVFDNRDYIDANELTIKTAFLTLLSNDIFYMVDSERPLRRGYADLTMILRPEMRQYQLLDLLLEFKFVKLSEIGLGGREVREKTTAELLALDSIQTKLSQARRQGQEYRASLQTTHGNRLKLHTFAVVAIGFERLLWEEVK
ncbi:MAG: AAA family ATPase [Caldilineaceae bacterium]|nr:AAA family ATPase [Caldilineaceae bacterium]